MFVQKLTVWLTDHISTAMPTEMILMYIIRCLQSVQNTVAQLVFRIWRSEHITPMLISCHWLHVPECISFKLAVLTYWSIDGTSPSYLQSCFIRVTDMTSRRRLRSSASHCLEVLPVQLSTVSQQAGVHSCRHQHVERLSVPHHICTVTRVFRQHLMTFIFSRSYPDILLWLTYIIIYLLLLLFFFFF